MISSLLNMQFAHPYFLWAIPVLILLFFLWLYFRYRKDKAAMTLSNTGMFDNYVSWKSRFLVMLPFLRLISLCLILVALARPQSSSTDQKISSYGIDMVISMDISSSMLAQDFKPNRLEAAKDVASRFIMNRPSDRIGLVVFAGESFTQVPITTDHKIVQSQLSKVKNGLLSDGTAIGMGIGTGVNRLKDSKAKSKVIILMTDGVNNTGLIDPITATEAAMQFDIKIYTIGIGTEGEAYMPAYMLPNGSVKYDYLPVMIDEELLTEISKMTNGKYYRAKDKESLEAIYEEIDQLEKTEIESSQSIRVEELFYNFAALAILLLFIEQVLKYSLLRSFP